MATGTKRRAARTAERTEAQASNVTTTQGNVPALLNEDKLKRLYTCMLKCRMVEERASLLFRKGKLSGEYQSAIGHEATEVGTTIDLGDDDTILTAHRDFASHVMKGTRLESLFAQLFAVNGRGGTSTRHKKPIDPASSPTTVATEMSIGTGVALACKLQKRQNVVIAFCAAEESVVESWREAVAFAGMQKLPIIYVIESDFVMRKTGGRRDVDSRLPVQAELCGVPTITVDGNDVVAVYRVASEAMSRARSGIGPTLIDCKAHHHGAGQPAGDIASGEVRYWTFQDPIEHMEHYLSKKGMWSEPWKAEIVGEIKRGIDDAVKLARSLPLPGQDEGGDRVYSLTSAAANWKRTVTGALGQQRQAAGRRTAQK